MIEDGASYFEPEIMNTPHRAYYPWSCCGWATCKVCGRWFWFSVEAGQPIEHTNCEALNDQNH